MGKPQTLTPVLVGVVLGEGDVAQWIARGDVAAQGVHHVGDGAVPRIGEALLTGYDHLPHLFRWRYTAPGART